VHYDDLKAGREATEVLIARGHRKIAYVDFTRFHEQPDSHYSRVDRHAGYVQVMQQAGLIATPREQFAGVAGKARLQTLIQLFQSPNRPTAIITYDGPERVLLAAAMAGLRVPEDLSIISFDEELPIGSLAEDGENYVGLSVASLRLPTSEAGQLAVELLLKKIENPGSTFKPHVLPLRLDEGDTLANASR
jgi:DNA-binding LacI/PurR family transcriptional regulator